MIGRSDPGGMHDIRRRLRLLDTEVVHGLLSHLNLSRGVHSVQFQEGGWSAVVRLKGVSVGLALEDEVTDPCGLLERLQQRLAGVTHAVVLYRAPCTRCSPAELASFLSTAGIACAQDRWTIPVDTAPSPTIRQLLEICRC